MTENRVLGPGHHRVAVTQFTLLTQNGRPSGESSFKSFDELCAWVKKHGYDGLELGRPSATAVRERSETFVGPQTADEASARA
eukprot:SAG31_NODE_658_length_13104_cov_4.409919_20_plen_83_part_00